MTAVAKLPEKWREEAKFDASTPEESGYKAALLDCADELTAALSPAELGGVELPVGEVSDGFSGSQRAVHLYGPIRCQPAPGTKLYTTPRAAEAEWLPIESAPKDGTEIWLGAPNIMRVAFWYSPVDLWIDFSAAEADERGLPMSMLGVSFVPTHWHKLPHRIPEPCPGFVCNGAPG